MTADVYYLYLATVAVFFATPPGPSQILMISNSLTHGVRPSLATVAGDLSANALQMLAAGLGLAALIATSAHALTVIKWMGVAYLLWHGIRMFLSKPKSLSGAAQARPSPRKLYLQGFFTSAANPKAVFFFAALFPQFIVAGAPIGPQLLILGGTYIVIDGLILIALGLSADRFLGFLRTRGRLLNRVSGLMMIAAAALLGAKDVQAR